ncbi:MAG: SurA N-terminal domain-containing protein [Kiritimatiellaeota bacterium]|nr:SurA N-terminal domain-containing protein [Kiritimatiellota bacterium]
MKRSLFAAALAMAGTACWAQNEAGTHSPMLLDGVAAYVNDATITISEVMIQVGKPSQDMTRSQQMEWKLKMYQRVLDAMIDQRLILEYAKKSNVQLQPWAVDAHIRETVSTYFDGDMTQLYDWLADRKITNEEYKKKVEEDLILQAMRYQYVTRRVTVTPLEIRAEYEANKAKYQTETAVALSMIVLAPPEQEAEGTVDERAQIIVAALQEGTVSFADLARKYSCDSKATSGGAWGKINPEEVLHEDIVGVLARLRPGQISPLIMLKDYGYIIRKDEQQDMRMLTFDEAAQFVEGHLRMEKSEKMYKDWVSRLRDEAAYISVFKLPEVK